MSEQMSYEDAVAAIEGASNADAGVTPEPAAPAPIQPDPATPPGEITDPAAPSEAPARELRRDEQGRFAPPASGEPEAPSEDSFAQSFDPNTLSDELKGAYRQMQADYTRKTQDLSEQRKQLEALGDPESLQVAAQLYERIQDPQQWPALHAELSAAMQQRGLSPAQADVAAAQQLQDATTAPAEPAAVPDIDALLREDPELKPLVDRLRAMEAQLAETTSSIQAEREAEEAQRMHMALVGELQRQESVIRENNPKIHQEDVDLTYELSTFHNGNLMNANERLEGWFQSRLQRYFAEKATAEAGNGPQPPGSGATLTGEVVEKPKTLEEAYEASLEYIRQVEAADTA